MAVIPMQKVRAVVHQHDVDDFLGMLQRAGVMEFTSVTTDDDEVTSITSAVAPNAALYARVQHATGFLASYEKPAGLWTRLRRGATVSYTEAAISELLRNTDAAMSVVTDVEALQVQLAEASAAVKALEEQRALLQVWQPVTNRLQDLDTRFVVADLLKKTDDTAVSIADTVAVALADAEVVYTLEVYDVQTALLVTAVSDAALVATKLQTVPVETVARPIGVEAAQVELAAVEEQLAGARGQLGVVHDQAEHAAHTHLQDLRTMGEVLEWEHDRFATVATSKSTATTVVFEGWLQADQRVDIEAQLATERIAAAFTDLATAADEEPPVEIVNPAFLQPFEVVTRLYGMPGYRDLDPTLFLAGFFFIFFGLSLTDVGYGITLMLVATIVLTLFKVSSGVRTFMKLLLFMGFGSALLGMLFGGYLGIPSEALPTWLQSIQLFDPIGDPLPVFYLALGLGVVQVMFGLMLKIYSEARNGRLLDGIMDKGPWLLGFVLGILYVGVITDYVSFVTTDVLVNLGYVAVALIVVTAARHGEGVVGKIIAALAALYNDTIGYFSDILSYSRLLALGLATTALAFAINLIAELVSGTPVVGSILAAAILVFGHVLALVINTLGAFIHSARLQFVEFFGKFIDGSGRAFTPLRRSSRYITTRSE